MIDRFEKSQGRCEPWPSFKRGRHKKSEHATDDVVIMEVMLQPFSVLYLLRIVNIKIGSVFKEDQLTGLLMSSSTKVMNWPWHSASVFFDSSVQ